MRSPRQFFLAPAILTLAFLSPGLRAEGPRERVTFDTLDQVELRGTFYPSVRGQRAPCVLLLHELGSNSSMEGWDLLARAFQEKGLAVLSFDFRGHGDSTTLGEDFWNHPVNRTLRSYRSVRTRDRLSFRDFSTLYHSLMLVNDIAAAKRFLDRKNDAGECNSANLVLVGAESGAALGALWLATEWQRRPLRGGYFQPLRQAPPEGEDIACAVWLSLRPSIGSWRVPVDSWVRAAAQEKVPMYFLYGEDSTVDAQYAHHLVESVLRGDRGGKLTGRRGLPDTRLAGHELLGSESLGTNELIVTYVDKVLEERGLNAWEKCNVETSPFAFVPFEHFLR